MKACTSRPSCLAFQWRILPILGLVFANVAIAIAAPVTPPPPPKFVAPVDTSTALGFFTPRDNAKTLVVMIHGWNSDRSIWAQGKIDIQSRSVFRTDVWDYDWSKDSAVFNPYGLVAPSSAHGQYIAFQALTKGNYDHVQLISHSAGVYANEIAARLIQRAKPRLTIQQTVLDGFMPGGVENQIGLANSCIDNYFFREKVGIPLFGRVDYLGDTNVPIPRAANYDLTPVNPAPQNTPLGIAQDHAYPYRWYQGTVKGKPNENAPKSAYGAYGYGFTKQVADGADGLPGFPKAWPSMPKKNDAGKLNVLEFVNASNTIRSQATSDVPKPKPQRDWFGKLSATDLIDSGGGGLVAIDEPTPGDLRARLGKLSVSSSEFAYATFNFDNSSVDPVVVNALEFEFLFTGPSDNGVVHVLTASADGAEWLELAAFNQEFVFDPTTFTGTTPIWLGDLLPGEHALAFRYDSLGGLGSVELRNLRFSTFAVAAIAEPATVALWLCGLLLLFIGRRKQLKGE